MPEVALVWKGNGVSTPIIETERLLLRPWEERDRAPFATLNADPVVMEFLAKTLTRAESDAYIDRAKAHFAANGFGLFAVELKETGAFVGLVGITQVPFESHFTPAVEIGWRMLKEYWGCGFAPEAAKASLQFGFNTLGLEEIVAFTIPVNVRSQRVMEKIGMERDPEGDFDHPKLPEGHPKRRHVLYRIARPPL